MTAANPTAPPTKMPSRPHRSVFAILSDPNFGSGAALNYGRADAGGPSTEPRTARALSERAFQSGAVQAKCPDLPRAVFFDRYSSAIAVASRHVHGVDVPLLPAEDWVDP